MSKKKVDKLDKCLDKQKKKNFIVRKWNGKICGGINMENVISLQSYFDEKSKEINSYSITDMILNPQKRKETYDYYDSIYEDTEEQKEIFEAWKKRRNKGDD